MTAGILATGCSIFRPAAGPSDAAPVARSPSSGVADSLPLPSLRDADYVLLGEVHDNAAQHRLRARWLQDMAGQGRFVLAMEQFDLPAQPAIDAAQQAGISAEALARQARFSFRGWQWPDYEPYVTLALRRQLPLLAVNLPAARVMAAARGELPEIAQALDGIAWPPAAQRAMAEDIRAGHCRMLPERAIPAMVTAQRARDVWMAKAMVDAHRRTSLPVVLLAGNQHVRRDLGVPVYLRALQPQARIVSVGFLESPPQDSQDGPPQDSQDGPQEAALGSPFDRVVVTAPQPRDDPCARFAASRAGGDR